jgi:hypothetical protein
VVKTALALVAALALSLACGKDRGPGPSTVSAPAPPAAVAFTVVSGETQAAVPGARVVVNGIEHVADSQGRVTTPAGLAPTTLVDIVAPGYFDRQTQLSRRGSAAQFTLWPRESATGLSEHFTSEVVYTSSAVADPVPGAAMLTRWATAVTQVHVRYLGPADDAAFLAFSERALAVQSAAVDDLTQASDGRVAYRPPAPSGAPVQGTGRIDMRIYPDFPTCRSSGDIWGVASLSEGEIVSATVTYCHQRAAESLGLSVHELGHTFGLRHSSDASDVMRAFGRRTERLSDRERQVMRLMLQRPGGNRFPDNDRSARASARRDAQTACRP